jgi:hypothetical protein
VDEEASGLLMFDVELKLMEEDVIEDAMEL